jgi:DNA-binding CsgD family transcriptional regulator
VATLARRVGAPVDVAGEVAPPCRASLDGDHHGAARLWHELGCPYDEAMELVDANDETSLREALAILDRLGAKAVLPVVQRALRSLGVRSVPRGQRAESRRDPWGLTRRERDVLAGLRNGQTNATIAAELVLSERTVEHHVSSVLAKMRAGSRQEAARMADDADALIAAG